MSSYYPGITTAGLIKKKPDMYLKFEANALVNNVGGFTEPQLWEDVKALHGGITRENKWILWGDYFRALGEKGGRMFGKFIPSWEYTEVMEKSEVLRKLREEMGKVART